MFPCNPRYGPRWPHEFMNVLGTTQSQMGHYQVITVVLNIKNIANI